MTTVLQLSAYDHAGVAVTGLTNELLVELDGVTISPILTEVSSGTYRIELDTHAWNVGTHRLSVCSSGAHGTSIPTESSIAVIPELSTSYLPLLYAR
jgi:hypothetical protein